MRIAALIVATAVALTLTACNRTDEAATADATTEAAEASGAAADTTVTAEQAAAEAAAAANAPSGPPPGQTVDPDSAPTPPEAVVPVAPAH